VSLADRQLQTRRYTDVAEAELLVASASVLQDLGFNLDESEAELGLIVASKRRDVADPASRRFFRFLWLLADVDIPHDVEQRIRVALVSWPHAAGDNTFLVRVTFQREVWNNENDVSRRETLNEPALYEQFFDRLSKSLFLEAYSL
jgi:hypothetical protein